MLCPGQVIQKPCSAIIFHTSEVEEIIGPLMKVVIRIRYICLRSGTLCSLTILGS